MTEHYFTENQTSPFKPAKILVKVRGMEIEIYTAGGVFSPKKIDIGTQLLIEKSHIEKGWKVLDLGCGYGAVGIILKKAIPSLAVVMSDVNSRAVKLAQMNAELHKLDVTVVQSDGYAALNRMQFDTILLNPPQTAGKDVCFRLIEESAEHLLPGGTLQLVARTKKGGKHLSQKMEEVFGNVEPAAKGAGYRIYVSKKK